MHTREYRMGSSLVEFVLLFPLLIAMIAGLFFVALTGLRQIALTHEAQRWARLLALGTTKPPPSHLSAQIRPLLSQPPLRPRQAPRRLEVVEVALTRNRITARAQELRVVGGANP